MLIGKKKETPKGPGKAIFTLGASGLTTLGIGLVTLMGLAFATPLAIFGSLALDIGSALITPLGSPATILGSTVSSAVSGLGYNTLFTNLTGSLGAASTIGTTALNSVLFTSGGFLAPLFSLSPFLANFFNGLTLTPSSPPPSPYYYPPGG